MFSKIHNVRAGASDGKGRRSSVTTVAASGLHTLPSWSLIFWEFTYQYTRLWQINCIHPYRGLSLGLKELGSSICSDGLPGGSVVKNPSANAGDAGSILGLGRSPGKGNGDPLRYYCQENPIDRETCLCIQSMGLQRARHE